MAKYDIAFKLAVVKAYLSGGGGYRTVAEKFGIPSHNTVKKWIKAYEVLGESSLDRKKSIKTYSVQFKLDVLHYKLRTSESYQNVALNFDINEPSIIANWMYLWQKEGERGLSRSKGRPTMSNKPNKQNKKSEELTKEQQLERENELLRAENAYLKKLRALGINIPSRLRK
jgi:transposase